MLRIHNTLSPFLHGRPVLLSVLLQVTRRAKAEFTSKKSFEQGISGLSLFTINSHVNTPAPIIQMPPNGAVFQYVTGARLLCPDLFIQSLAPFWFTKEAERGRWSSDMVRWAGLAACLAYKTERRLLLWRALPSFRNPPPSAKNKHHSSPQCPFFFGKCWYGSPVRHTAARQEKRVYLYGIPQNRAN